MKKNFLTKVDYFLCLFFACAFAAAPYYMENGTCEFNAPFFVSTVVYMIVFLIITYAFRKYLQELYLESRRHDARRKKIVLGFEKMMLSKYSILYVACIIFLCWLPSFIFLYPGTLINDTWGEFQQYIWFIQENVGLSDHHPIFDTFLMGTMIVPLAELTGRWHMSIFLYVLLQAFFTCIAFAYSIKYMQKKLEIGTKTTIGIMLVYCILPIFPTSVQTVSKDALFSWIFVLFLICYFEMIRSQGNVLNSKDFLLKVTILTMLCCLTKKVGMYVVLFSLLILFLFIRNNRKYIFLPIVSSFILMFVFMPWICEELNVVQGGKQEMLSIPFQQTARYVKTYGEDITEDEYIIIDKVLTMNDLAERYNPTNADPVKDFYQKGKDEDYVEYVKVWIKQGLRHPRVYIEAFNCMISGWFSWSEYDPLMNMDWHSQLNPEMIPEWVAVRTKSLATANAYQEIYHNLYQNPFLKVFFTYGLYASLIPGFALGTVLRRWNDKKVKYWLAVLPMIFSIGMGLWLAPVSTHFEGRRYLYPLTYTAPLMIAWCLYVYKNNKKDEVQ